MTLGERLDLLAPLTGPEVYRVPLPTSGALVTAAGRERYRRWALAGCPTADPGNVVVYTADLSMNAAVRAAIGRIPDAAVVWHLARNVLVVGVGREDGWAGVLPALPSGDEPTRLVVVRRCAGDEAFASVVAHEAAHCWLEPIASEAPSLAAIADTDERAATFATFCSTYDMREEGLQLRRQQERLAASLAYSWGFRGEAADSWLCAQRCRLAGE